MRRLLLALPLALASVWTAIAENEATDPGPITLQIVPLPGLPSELAFGETPLDLRRLKIRLADARWLRLVECAAELCAEVATRGPMQAQRLSGTLARCGDVGAFRISPDGARVVFSADLESGGVVELFVAPLDGSAAPLRLSAPFGAGGGVERSPYPSFPPFEFTPDASRVLYYARAGTGNPLMLHCATLDGSGTVTLAEASAFHLAPDGALATCLGVGGELFAVPCDGSGLPLSLSGPPAPGASLLNAWAEPEFAISSDGARVVFTVDGRLCSVPVAGTAPAVAIDGTPRPGVALGQFRILPGAQRVLFTSDRVVSGRDELHLTAIGGGAKPVRLSSSLVPGGDVLTSVSSMVQPTPHGFVYVADGEQNDVFELYLTTLTRSAPSAPPR